MAYIESRNITKMFGDNWVLGEIIMEVQKGDLTTLLGPSGCGKSMLLCCLSGLESVTEGQIFLDGEDITETPPSQRNVSIVFQQYSLFPNMTVGQNIAFGLKMKKAAPELIGEKVRGAICMVELEGKEKSYSVNLPGGQQQRVVLAKSIVMEPKVSLLDEPLSAIDAKPRKSLQSSIWQIYKELGLTTIFMTHDQDEATVVSGVIQLFHVGKIEQSGSPIATYMESKTKFAAGFIGNYNILTANEFIRVTGKPYEASEDVVIRPETISVSRTVEDVVNAYHFEGIIKNNTPRGNVLRHDIDVDGVMLKADVLSRSFQLYENGSGVQLAAENYNCLALK